MENRNIYQKFVKAEPYFHVLLWCMVLFYPYIKYLKRDGGYMMSFTHELNSLLFKMTISYFLYLWFFPKKNKKKYLLIVILAYFINACCYEYFDRFFHEGDTHFWKHFAANSLTYVSFGVVFFTIYSLKNVYRKQVEIDRLTQEKQQAEIKVLKAKVNPHFLFNTLNTIYANALRKDDKTPDLILKLSDGFRYVLHEGQKEYVMLNQELQHLKDYIILQQERLSNKIVVNFSQDIDNEKQQISPLLLIAFVENAFKYSSIIKGKNHVIEIRVLVKKNTLFFLCENSFKESAKQNIDKEWKESGIGIKNTKKRLELLYPERHQLEIEKDKDRFKVKLEIQL
ncbi:histidine kinase [Aquimarina sp. MMG016]|uniref:sensor histidine kinase n=1 Tax=Aquimarina sp. MMG016 TaxID=2822690 RepID=UPI001B39E5F9|nr:histidine kinase [Aquimarina sp. MMG016]MBQ4821168.1 histidine kinase [Aquimarina sp. MMG016]